MTTQLEMHKEKQSELIKEYSCQKDEAELEERALLASVRANMKYDLQGLINECDPNQPLSEEDLVWLNDPPVGREVL
jgi:hypothetical protein